MIRRAFTLLEVMVAIVLLTIVSGVVGLKMHTAIQKKKFHSDIERLKIKMALSQKLAIANEGDWAGTLKKKGKGWIFEASSEEGKKLAPLHLDPMEIYFKGKKVDALTFEFFASGHTSPDGVFLFIRDEQRTSWATSELFLRNEGERSDKL